MKKVWLNLPSRRTPAGRPSAALPGCVLAIVLASQLAGLAGPPSIDPRAASAGRKEVRSTRAYLTTLGPIPIRIRRPSVPGPLVVLPPLAMKDPDPVGQPTSTNLTAEIPRDTRGSDTAGGPSEKALDSSASAGDGEGGEASDSDARVGPIVTPSMLVRYFKSAGSNSVGGGFSVPVFIPAVPPTGGDTNTSSATYRLR